MTSESTSRFLFEQMAKRPKKRLQHRCFHVNFAKLSSFTPKFQT